MKLDYERPYIVRLFTDNKNHLIASLSDGTEKDVGYLPTGRITIYKREVDTDEGYK